MKNSSRRVPHPRQLPDNYFIWINTRDLSNIFPSGVFQCLVCPSRATCQGEKSLDIEDFFANGRLIEPTIGARTCINNNFYSLDREVYLVYK